MQGRKIKSNLVHGNSKSGGVDEDFLTAIIKMLFR